MSELWPSAALRLLAVVVACVMLAASCRVQVDDFEIAQQPADQSALPQPEIDLDVDPPRMAEDLAPGVLPAVGPLPNASHWHAAYVVRICNDVLDSFESTSDPLGIHTHGDGLMHVHPFVEQAGFEQATLSVFADSVDMVIEDGALTLPGGGTWRDGDLCDGVPGRVFIDRWQGPLSDSPVERLFVDLEDVRFEADGELYQIAFAPEDSPPVVPPAEVLLPEVSNLDPPPAPWVVVEPGLTGPAVFWAVDEITTAPCRDDQIPESLANGGEQRCFGVTGEGVSSSDGVRSSRAVALNRRPAVEIDADGPLQELIGGHFAVSQDPFVFALEVDGSVLAVARIFRPPASTRVVISSGFSEGSARATAEILNQ